MWKWREPLPQSSMDVPRILLRGSTFGLSFDASWSVPQAVDDRSIRRAPTIDLLAFAMIVLEEPILAGAEATFETTNSTAVEPVTGTCACGHYLLITLVSRRPLYPGEDQITTREDLS